MYESIIKNLKISELSLWDQNPRFPNKYFKKSEQELIEYFYNKKSFNIHKLLINIVNNFDLIPCERLVVLIKDSKNIVLEGNRRLMVYKLLLNPNLSTDNNLRNEILKLKSKININKNYTIECIVVNDFEIGKQYIEQKHLNNNMENWGEQERSNYKMRVHKANNSEKLKIEIEKIIREDVDLPEEIKDQVLGKGYVTNLWRILNSSPANDLFGFDFDNDTLSIKDEDFKDKLKIIIFDIINKKTTKGQVMNSRSLNTNEEKEQYLKSINKDDCSDINEQINSKTTTNLFGDKSLNIKKNIRINPKSTLRNHLIPDRCRIIISEVKINNIYRELRDDLLLDDTNKSVPNAIGVLFRVFLEVSIDYFYNQKGLFFKSETKLAGKITKVADYMQQNNIAKEQQLTNIRAVATDKNNILAIENFHKYVHTYTTQPTPSDLKLKWDNLQEFFEILFNEINKK